MFYLLLWGIVIYLGIMLLFNILRWFVSFKKNHLNYHYFIIVKNGQETIEWVIRSINIASFIEGKHKKISVIDLGSTDDTLAIMERFLLHRAKIDNLYTNDIHLKQLTSLIKASFDNGEKPIIIYINSREDSTALEEINREILNPEA